MACRETLAIARTVANAKPAIASPITTRRSQND
jgi:hypothetical protein